MGNRSKQNYTKERWHLSECKVCRRGTKSRPPAPTTSGHHAGKGLPGEHPLDSRHSQPTSQRQRPFDPLPTHTHVVNKACAGGHSRNNTGLATLRNRTQGPSPQSGPPLPARCRDHRCSACRREEIPTPRVFQTNGARASLRCHPEPAAAHRGSDDQGDELGTIRGTRGRARPVTSAAESTLLQGRGHSSDWHKPLLTMDPP